MHLLFLFLLIVMNLQCSDISILNVPVFQYLLSLVTLCYLFVQSYPDSWVQGSRHIHQMPNLPSDYVMGGFGRSDQTNTYEEILFKIFNFHHGERGPGQVRQQGDLRAPSHRLLHNLKSSAVSTTYVRCTFIPTSLVPPLLAPCVTADRALRLH